MYVGVFSPKNNKIFCANIWQVRIRTQVSLAPMIDPVHRCEIRELIIFLLYFRTNFLWIKLVFTNEILTSVTRTKGSMFMISCSFVWSTIFDGRRICFQLRFFNKVKVTRRAIWSIYSSRVNRHCTFYWPSLFTFAQSKH